ncbi:hypothetical protein C3492_41250 [Streptomyces sp. Ru62]|uniref:tetratricopeptide repeat protein n=1 Tax=Streptomyces sp. Ru62 TaxID=2080745 RepID=UPI000CDE0E31|nr:tetratricopeptide repeat protein [Streptomyces sp. Ru62]POX57846.1 hypothetical protein C3492_41250 [Streptomyces sp. Ru62]
MRAVTVRDREAGATGLTLEDLPPPRAAENDVILRVHAAGFTRGELDWAASRTDRAGRGIYLEYFDESALPMAVRYARAAAEAGFPAGQRTYGHMLATGLGVEEDRARAAELFRAAAEGGDAYGMFNLAQLVEDPEESLRLFEAAAHQGVVPAGAVLGDRLSALDRDEEALGWYVWAAERGHTGAMNAAACWYRDGFGTTPDPVQAVRWFLVMLAHGDGNGIHEAIQLAKARAMEEEQIREAGRLARDPGSAEALIDTVLGGKES